MRNKSKLYQTASRGGVKTAISNQRNEFKLYQTASRGGVKTKGTLCLN